jgi:5-methyltetrahydrofolate--homocysteine methyltransferase
VTSSSSSRYLAALERSVLIYDGAMGTSIDAFELTAADYGGEATYGCRDYLVLTRPDVIRAIHASFMDAGCDVLETCTFQATSLRLAEWGLGEQVRAINLAAARLAREVADGAAARDGRPRFVAGSIGPTGKLPSSDDPALSDITFAELSAIIAEQAAALIEGGADVLLVETSVDILEVKAALDGIRQAKAALNRPDVGVQAQIFLDLSGRMLLGTEIPAVIATLEAMPVDVIGLNCSTGPEHMREAIRLLCRHSRLPISCIPNAGLPIEVEGETVYPMEPEPFARILGEFVADYGVAVVGGCCGTRPAHLQRLRDVIGSRAPLGREIEAIPSVSSGVRAAALRQDGTLTVIGERVNTLGSRKVKRLLLRDDYDGVLEVAREQVDGGAHLLDVCVAMTERADEREQMTRLLKKLTMNIELPLVIDTTEADVLEAALAMYPGRAVINSLSLEGGRGDKIDRTMPLMARYGAASIAMTIDEDGMAHTAGRKLAIAQRIADIARQEYGIPADALIFDVLTFPITTGQEELRTAAIETIEGIRAVKQHIPGCFTTLGVSNLSFGVAPHARAALNSVFLNHAVAAGLDSAIINPSHVTPYAEIPADQIAICEDLIFNRRDDALARFIQFFEAHTDAGASEKHDPTDGMAADRRIHWKILHRKKDAVEDDIDELMAERLGVTLVAFRSELPAAPAEPTAVTPRGQAAVDILNTVLLPAMKEVGDLFGAGQLILPFVLQSAEVMKKTVAHLERYLDRVEGTSKGRVVLATVYGDVHDIGKNLVNTILSNNGYTVYDLGKQVPINTILEKAIDVRADAIGLSALLVSTSKQMPLCVQELHRRGLSIPVLVGGAAINRQYGQRISFIDETTPYAAGVFYCKDAFEGLETMDRLVDPAQRATFVAGVQRDAGAVWQQRQRGRVMLAEVGRANLDAGAIRSAVRRDVAVPTPPFWGASVIDRIRLADVVECLDRNALYRLQWGARNAKGAEWEALVAEFDTKVRDLVREAERDGWLQPQVVLGYFPCRSAGHELIIYDPADRTRELERLTFPRQPERERLCLADYFHGHDDAGDDVVALQIVTMGAAVDALTETLQHQGDYSRSYFIHGLSVSLAEALAEYTNRLVRRSLGLGDARGKRYSWGYPACPDLEEHAKVFRLLPAERIGVSLTDAFQLVPEQSTAAMVVHHPEARYFSIGSGRERAEDDARALA